MDAVGGGHIGGPIIASWQSNGHTHLKAFGADRWELHVYDLYLLPHGITSTERISAFTQHSIVAVVSNSFPFQHKSIIR